MKIFVGVPVWNRVDQIVWLIDSIAANFVPETTVVAFLFDGCVDGSVEHFQCVRGPKLEQRGYPTVMIECKEEVREVGGHNRLLSHFMEHTDCDMAVISQDDQMYSKPVAENLDGLCQRYPHVGVIGGRDGYHASYRDMSSSKWSASNAVNWLEHGQFAFKTMLNSGPVCYRRQVVEKVGLLDENFRAFYVWDDYCMRALKAGYSNVVMGMDLAHKKIGRGLASTFYTSEISIHDLGLLHAKHGKLF